MTNREYIASSAELMDFRVLRPYGAPYAQFKIRLHGVKEVYDYVDIICESGLCYHTLDYQIYDELVCLFYNNGSIDFEIEPNDTISQDLIDELNNCDLLTIFRRYYGFDNDNWIDWIYMNEPTEISTERHIHGLMEEQNNEDIINCIAIKYDNNGCLRAMNIDLRYRNIDEIDAFISEDVSSRVCFYDYDIEDIELSDEDIDCINYCIGDALELYLIMKGFNIDNIKRRM